MQKKDSRSLLEKITDGATIISAFGIVIAIVQMCSQNKQFNDSFELSNKQFQYQLKQDSLQDKADDIKDYRDLVKFKLALKEFEENKKTQKEETERNESQFQKNILTLQELVRTNRQSNEYVVSSQRPFLGLEFSNFIFTNKDIKFSFEIKNNGYRKSLLQEIRYFFIDFDLKDFEKTIFSAESIEYPNLPIVSNNGVSGGFNFEDTKYCQLKKNDFDKVFFLLFVNYVDELKNKVITQKFYFYILKKIQM